MGKYVTDYFLYRWRFVLGYGVIGLALVGLLLIVGLYIPGGLSESERQSAIASDALSFASFTPDDVVNLPFHLLQHLSLTLFGVSAISIKLPALILGFISAIGMFILLRTWFRRNVALITTVLVIATGQFLFVAQSGSPSIVYIFWSIWLLVAAMMVSRRARFGTAWKIALFAVAALSLYTPLSAYILLALASAIALHPHLRYVVRRLSKAKLAIGTACAIVLLIPLGYSLIQKPALIWQLLGIPAQWPDLFANLSQLLHQYFDFISPSSGALITPIYGLGSMIFILFGVLRLVTTKYTARSYIITAWLVLLLPILIINPNFVSVTFVPVILLMGMGIGRLLGHWYQLFPRNPYARIAGLIPLAILIGGMVFSGIDRYMYGYHYDPQTASNFSKDIRLLNAQLRQTTTPTSIIATAGEVPFYQMVARHAKDVSVSEPQTATMPPSGTTLVTHNAKPSVRFSNPEEIITDALSNDADRFYIYKTEAK